jgi:urease accessory protein
MSRLVAITVLSCLTLGLSAHPGHESGASAGLLHPLLGLDHLLAMVCVGLLAVRCGGRWRWALPGAFVVAMALGGSLLGAVSVAPMEWLIAASVAVLGLLVAGPRSPILALVLCTVAGSLHGHAHLSEGSGSGFLAGMLVMTAVLHGVGFGVGTLALRQVSAQRVTGAALATAGLALTIFALA